VPKEGGYSSTVSTYLDPVGCVVGERWLIHGMNHFWSGGTTDPEYANFTDPKGPNGAEATWAFVSQYTMSSTADRCTVAKPCPAKWLKLRVPTGAKNVKATVNGERVDVNVTGRKARVRLPSDVRTSTAVELRGRAKGKKFTRTHIYDGCG
jgi:hypothetical protein